MSASALNTASSLLVISSAPGKKEGEAVILDKKFAEGMKVYAASWPGKTTCMLRAPKRDALFLDRFDPESLPFGIQLRPANHAPVAEDLEGYDTILVSGDNPAYLHLAELSRSLGKSVYFTIEYIPETRRQIALLDRTRSLPSKAKALLHITLDERRRRKAFSIARGLQANGYPAAELYRPINANTVLYLDNRIDPALLATEDEMAARQKHLMAKGPLRLIHSGRLESLKGSQDLIPIARKLREREVNFLLDIFGGGSLEVDIRNDIARYDLGDHIRLHGVVDFATELVPFARQNSDVFLSCHRQSDPSCSYLENMGCGLPVAGYANRMWAALAQDSKAGWVAPFGDWSALADTLADLAANPVEVMQKSVVALDFAKAHLFDIEFGKRIAQMKS